MANSYFKLNILVSSDSTNWVKFPYRRPLSKRLLGPVSPDNAGETQSLSNEPD